MNARNLPPKLRSLPSKIATVMSALLLGCGWGGTPGTPVNLSSDNPVPIVITSGGTYSGHWQSNNPAIPAVEIVTDEPVVLENSTVSGPGDLIVLKGKTLADLTVRNVTGLGLDPGTAGVQRGAFLRASSFRSLTVQNCTISGTSFGILAGYGTAETLNITNNKGFALDDRASDGHGGFEAARPVLGHFIQLAQLSAPSGATVAWNELKQTIGTTSLEDPINIYRSRGASGHPILVHDNYVEGYSSPGGKYSGSGLIADGDSTGDTAWVLFEENQVVHTAGNGVAIAAGHDITARNNRVVSCGKDAQGTYTHTGESASVLWNYYRSANFYNNVITGTTGGLVALNSEGLLTASDDNAVSEDATDYITASAFTDPCWTDGLLDPAAEDAERSVWAAKIAANHVTLGAQH